MRDRKKVKGEGHTFDPRWVIENSKTNAQKKAQMVLDKTKKGIEDRYAGCIKKSVRIDAKTTIEIYVDEITGERVR